MTALFGKHLEIAFGCWISSDYADERASRQFVERLFGLEQGHRAGKPTEIQFEF